MRRFVICFDGTWNDPDKGAKPTNVVKILRAIRSSDGAGISQIAFYDKGVGTAGGTDAFAGGGLGAGLTANVVDGFRFLANNYETGDEIYIFGFSRGAYTARSLAGLIGLAGLLEPGALGADLVRVMAIYGNHKLASAEKRQAIEGLGLRAFRPVPVRCVGVWDTVGSLGIPGDLGRTFLGGKYYFHDVELGAHIDVALHAVAVDEKRSAFSPTLWVSGDGRPARDGQIVEQVWFAGVHSNVGGSYADSGLSDIAFDWMLRRVEKHTDLAFDRAGVDAVGPETAARARGIESRTLLYKGSALYPYQRVIGATIPKGEGVGEWFRQTFPALDRRNIPPDGLQTVNEALHMSVLDRWKVDAVFHDCTSDTGGTPVRYRPVNLAAVVAAGIAGTPMPVVGWNGEPVEDPRAAWPSSAV